MTHYKSVNANDYNEITQSIRNYIIVENYGTFRLSDNICFVEKDDGRETGRVHYTKVKHMITDRNETGIKSGFLVLIF